MDGEEGLKWTPVSQVVDSLESAFESAFQNIQPTGKNIYVGIDVSGSMGVNIYNSPISAREAAAALALIVARSEPNHHIAAFAKGTDFQVNHFGGTTMKPIVYTQKDSLDSWMNKTNQDSNGRH